MPPRENDPPDYQEEVLYTRELTLPELHSQVPADLTESLSKRDRDTLDKLSIFAQRIDWLTEAVLLHNDAIRHAERRVLRVERWRLAVTSKWSVIGGAALLILPYIVPRLVAYLLPGGAP